MELDWLHGPTFRRTESKVAWVKNEPFWKPAYMSAMPPITDILLSDKSRSDSAEKYTVGGRREIFLLRDNQFRLVHPHARWRTRVDCPDEFKTRVFEKFRHLLPRSQTTSIIHEYH